MTLNGIMTADARYLCVAELLVYSLPVLQIILVYVSMIVFTS